MDIKRLVDLGQISTDQSTEQTNTNAETVIQDRGITITGDQLETFHRAANEFQEIVAAGGAQGGSAISGIVDIPPAVDWDTVKFLMEEAGKPNPDQKAMFDALQRLSP
ncbi:MAG TPA: hypothetical protein VFG11_04715, partial [Acidobacteriota bacterium]|nr:hypothetical protein [Acidobacteriota bacterium]